ncbi:crotonase/enoyl-CoA hydratase family protein [Corynebacterium jeikeium]|uniref:crotonase/enoyl-CoA hydratase family protein n=1 Tax=Corynebacterium jeikeium TaxID=38289 RepID=UPI00054E738E|nr:crotonase/enoyl-CoA hydratase family protein [Corynebacterium jeikeium]
MTDTSSPGSPTTPTAPTTSSTPGTDQLVTTEYSESIPGLVHVRLNRPRKLNSLTIDLLQQLISTAHTLRRDRSVRVVILSGAEGNFSAGLDFADTLKSPPRMLSHFIPRPLRGTNTFQEAPWAWRRLPFPVIAAVEGYCFGGGVQIALGADFRFTSNDAHWSVLEAKWGLVPDMSGIMSLKQLLPIDEVKRLAMTGEIFSGERAAELGLAKAVEDPLAAAEELAQQIIERSPDSVALAKKLVDETWETGARRTFARERLRQARLLVSKNAEIARKAAQKKIPPKFRPRTVR